MTTQGLYSSNLQGKEHGRQGQGEQTGVEDTITVRTHLVVHSHWTEEMTQRGLGTETDGSVNHLWYRGDDGGVKDK